MKIVVVHHIFDFSIFYIIKVNSGMGANSVHVAVPDDEMCIRILYLDPIGLSHVDAPAFYYVRIASRA